MFVLVAAAMVAAIFGLSDIVGAGVGIAKVQSVLPVSLVRESRRPSRSRRGTEDSPRWRVGSSYRRPL